MLNADDAHAFFFFFFFAFDSGVGTQVKEMSITAMETGPWIDLPPPLPLHSVPALPSSKNGSRLQEPSAEGFNKMNKMNY